MVRVTNRADKQNGVNGNGKHHAEVALDPQAVPFNPLRCNVALARIGMGVELFSDDAANGASGETGIIVAMTPEHCTLFVGGPGPGEQYVTYAWHEVLLKGVRPDPEQLKGQYGVLRANGKANV